MLKAARKHRKLTQAEVAARLSLSQNCVSHLEQHPDEISFKQLLAWCAAVGLELRLGERGLELRLGERESLVSTHTTEW